MSSWTKGWVLEAGTVYRASLDEEGALGPEQVAEEDITVEFLFAAPGFVAVKDDAGTIYFVPE